VKDTIRQEEKCSEKERRTIEEEEEKEREAVIASTWGKYGKKRSQRLKHIF
jgi:hypothetical protein